MTSDVPQKSLQKYPIYKTRRLSELFQPCTIAYSIIRSQKNCSLSIDLLWNLFQGFPNNSAFRAAERDLKTLTKFKSTLNKIISDVSFTKNDLKECLGSDINNTFIIENNIVTLNDGYFESKFKTIECFYALHPDLKWPENQYAALEFNYMTHFHTHQLDFEYTHDYKIEVSNSEMLTFDFYPKPEYLLYRYFCYKGKIEIPLITVISDLAKMRANIQGSNVKLSEIIRDIDLLVDNNPCFRVNQNSLQVEPCIVYESKGEFTINPFVSFVDFRYTEKRRPDTEQPQQLMTQHSREKYNKEIPIIEYLLQFKSIIGSKSFTRREIYEYAIAEVVLNYFDASFDDKLNESINYQIETFISQYAIKKNSLGIGKIGATSKNIDSETKEIIKQSDFRVYNLKKLDQPQFKTGILDSDDQYAFDI